jgi:hypothetical protein
MTNGWPRECGWHIIKDDIKQAMDNLFIPNNIVSNDVMKYEEQCYESTVTPPNLGVTGGDLISWPTMKTVISLMMMTNMSTHGIPATPLRLPLLLRIIQAHHI